MKWAVRVRSETQCRHAAEVSRPSSPEDILSFVLIAREAKMDGVHSRSPPKGPHPLSRPPLVTVGGSSNDTIKSFDSLPALGFFCLTGGKINARTQLAVGIDVKALNLGIRDASRSVFTSRGHVERNYLLRSMPSCDKGWHIP